MTCIVAKISNGKVHMAGDKLGSNGYTGSISKRPKIFFNREFLVGFCGSFRIGQLLEFSWSPPGRLEGTPLDTYIYSSMVGSIKEMIQYDGVEELGSGDGILFGYRGNIFSMQEDYALFEYDEYVSIGSGENEAMASLFTLSHIDHGLTPEEELAWAIRSAAVSKVGVSEEYDYLSENDLIVK